MTDAGGEREAAGGRKPGVEEESARRESIGRYLARQRELRGISIEELDHAIQSDRDLMTRNMEDDDDG